MSETISQVCNFEKEGSNVLETLLRDRSAKAPLLPDVDRNDIVATVVWYVWWERRQASNGETVQDPARTAQGISALALNFSRAKKKSCGIKRHG